MPPRRRRAPAPTIAPASAPSGAALWAERHHRLLVGGLLAVAALLRLVAYLQVRALPNATSDGLFYEETARQIVAAGLRQAPQAFNFSPLYVFFLAGLWKTVGGGVNLVRALQLLLGVGSTALIFLVARRLFNRTVALIALGAAALYAPFIHFELQLLSISLAVFLMLLALHLVLLAKARARPAVLLPAGLTLGVAVLGSPTLLVLAAPVTLWLALIDGDDGDGAAAGGASSPRLRLTRSGLGRAAIFLGGVLMGIAPATIWNLRSTGELVLVSSQGGVNFYIGNNPDAPGFFVVPKGMEDSLAGINLEGARRVAEAEAGRTLSAGQVSRHWFGKGLRFIAEDPADAARLLTRKAFLFANRYEVPLDLDQDAFKEYFPLLRWPLLSFGAVSLLGWLGAAIALRRWRAHALLLALLAAYALSVVAFFVSDRYRLPAVPLLIICAAFAVDWARQKHRARQVLSLLAAGLAAALGGALIVFAPTGLQGAHASLAFNMATGYLHRGDLGPARAALERCVRDDPDWLEARYKLAGVEGQLGDTGSALQTVDAVIARAPRNTDARRLRGELLLQRGLPRTAAAELAAVKASLPGDAALAAKVDEASRALRAAAAEPAEPRAARLARLSDDGWRDLDAHHYATAAASLAELLAWDPADSALRERTLAGLGFSYASLGRIDLATRAFEEALAINPDNAVLHKNLALIHLREGHPDRARPHIERFAALSPGDPMLAQFQSALAKTPRPIP